MVAGGDMKDIDNEVVNTGTFGLSVIDEDNENETPTITRDQSLYVKKNED